MPTEDPREPTSTADAPPRRRSRWIWVSALLTIIAAGFLIWGLTLQSDLDSTEQELASTSEELDSSKQALDAAEQPAAEPAPEEGDERDRSGGLVVAKALYDEFAEQLDATQDDLDATQQDLDEAEKTATEAEQDAAAAKQDAADASGETEKAEAQADQAKADVEAAEAKTAVAADCAKAYISAFGGLFEGESVRDQAPAVRKQLSSVTADCKDDLGGE